MPTYIFKICFRFGGNCSLSNKLEAGNPVLPIRLHNQRYKQAGSGDKHRWWWTMPISTIQFLLSYDEQQISERQKLILVCVIVFFSKERFPGDELHLSLKADFRGGQILSIQRDRLARALCASLPHTESWLSNRDLQLPSDLLRQQSVTSLRLTTSVQADRGSCC